MEMEPNQTKAPGGADAGGGDQQPPDEGFDGDKREAKPPVKAGDDQDEKKKKEKNVEKKEKEWVVELQAGTTEVKVSKEDSKPLEDETQTKTKERNVLEKQFVESPSLNASKRKELSKEKGMSEEQVKGEEKDEQEKVELSTATALSDAGPDGQLEPISTEGMGEEKDEQEKVELSTATALSDAGTTELKVSKEDSKPLEDETQTKINRRRSRTKFTEEQNYEFNLLYKKTHNPDVFMREELSQRLGLSEVQVQDWFGNRRARDKKKENQLHKGPDGQLEPISTEGMCTLISTLTLEEKDEQEKVELSTATARSDAGGACVGPSADGDKQKKDDDKDKAKEDGKLACKVTAEGADAYSDGTEDGHLSDDEGEGGMQKDKEKKKLKTKKKDGPDAE